MLEKTKAKRLSDKESQGSGRFQLDADARVTLCSMSFSSAVETWQRLRLLDAENMRVESHRSFLPLVQMFIHVLKGGYTHVLLLSLMNVLNPWRCCNMSSWFSGNYIFN